MRGTPAWDLWGRRALLPFGTALALLGCKDEEDAKSPAPEPDGVGLDAAADAPEPEDAEPPDPGQQDGDTGTPDVPAPFDLPVLSLVCSDCHDLEKLATTPAGAMLGPRDWLSTQGTGMLRLEKAIPAPGVTEHELPWPERGVHASASGSCGGCHPIEEDGRGHGVRAYAAAGKVFSAGQDCGLACHGWIPGEAKVEGYENASGSRPAYEGSLRPAALLEGAGTAHTKLWKEGSRPDPALFRIGAFNSGCGGCHNIAAEAHGTVTTCIDCHRFGGEEGAVHAGHVARIAGHVAELDPDAEAAGVSLCAYCHVQDDGPIERSRTACYGCHLSGHQPLDEAGTAHFWPIDGE